MNLRLLLPWALLTIGTLASWSLDASFNGAFVAVGILLIAFFKARLVLVHFMRVADASNAVRWFCEAWVVLAFLSLNAVYWLVPLL